MPHTFLRFESSLCPFIVAENNGAITHIYLRDAALPADAVEGLTPLLLLAQAQLLEYCAGTRRQFDLPLAPEGTPFQRKIWDALQTIPYGETCTYGHIAAQTGNPRACRAVGGANNRNPISVVIPCHRVVGADGSLVGYGGGLDLKVRLLDLERQHAL